MVTFPGERIVMTSPCRLLTTVFLAASAAALALPTAAAPIAAPSSSPVVPTLSVETVQWWGGGPYYDYYAPGYGYGYSWNPGGSLPAPGYAPVPSNAPMPGYAPVPGYASGYQAGAADVASCMERFRSYDPVSRTYMGRDRRRHPCPL
jgi:hypothetical protein